MGERTFSSASFARTRASVAREGGSATRRGEQRIREGLGLHKLVDPRGYGGIRRSISWLEPKGKQFVLLRGPAMLLETRFDTTGSMGDNVQKAFDSLPRLHHLLKEVEHCPLKRYDLHLMTSIFGDVVDRYVLLRTQAEMDVQAMEQLRLMVPEGDRGYDDEDPAYGIFAGAYLTRADIVKLGLKSYDFTVTDARGRGSIDDRERDDGHRSTADHNLIRIFGDDVYKWTKENDNPVDKGQLPTTKKMVAEVLKIAHGFVIQVGDKQGVTKFWTDLYGKERVVIIPGTELLPETEAAIIGLTEGVLDLQNLGTFLREDAELSDTSAKAIERAVVNIPLRAQAKLPNFNKIPKAGDLFAKKGDLWPIGSDMAPKTNTSSAPPAKKPGGKKDEVWL